MELSKPKEPQEQNGNWIMETPTVEAFAQLGRGHCMLLARDTSQETADWYTKKEAFPVTIEEEAWQNFLLPEGGWHFLRAPWCTGATGTSQCAPRESAESRMAESPTLARQPAGAHARALLLIPPCHAADTHKFSPLWAHFSVYSDYRLHTLL